MSDGRRQCAFNRPSATQSRVQGGGGNAYFLAPGGDAHGFAVVRQQSVLSCVASLLYAGGPAAICRFIASAVVNTINRVAVAWAWPHIFVKGFKRRPPFAHRDATSPVTVIGWVSDIAATLAHRFPNAVFRCPAKSVRGVRGDDGIPLEASATPRRATANIASLNSANGTALAHANPLGVAAVALPCVSQHGPSSECLPGQVVDAGWNRDRIFSSHDSILITGVVRMARQVQLLGCSCLYPNFMAA